MGTMRNVSGVFVCAPTNHMQDVETLQAIVSQFRKLGGKVPPTVEAALELAKAGRNVEESMNVACDGLFKFYVGEQFRCAKEAGFSSLEQYEQERRTDFTSDRVHAMEDCMLRVERKWQLTNIDYTINPYNKESALRQFLQRTRDQVLGITGKWVKKKALDKVKGKTPSYERHP